MKQAIIQHKGTLTDGGIIAGSGAAAFLNDQLPLVVGALTVILLVWRIVLAYQEYKINKKMLNRREADRDD